jgi:membrane associated rhomboid family serine protease
MTTTTQGTQASAPTCYRHPRRQTYVQCVRCDRYICPDCIRTAAVGQQCPQCVRAGSKTVRQTRTVLGGRASAAPVMTYAFIAVNVLAYLAELADPGIVNQLSDLGNGLARGGTLYLPVQGGVAVPGFHAIGIAHGQWYRLITGPFLHLLPTQPPLGLAHIVLNMWSLWVLGPLVEQMTGRLRFAALYLLSALGGSVAAYLIAPDTAAIGASGAIFGLAGGYFVISRRLGRDVGYANRLILSSLLWLVASAWFTSWQGHLGGLLAGGALTAAYAYAPARQRTIVQAAATVGVLLIALALVVLKTAQINAIGAASYGP